ncbi:MAG: succinate dehydrogenase cytochrome b subunit [Ignavibacteriae bacterium]|nr:succinate dehydrogenase cytochrome b subunit [Ignavibacteria bacterium]MBI3363772.1 succinate dehydrogenase cytochrome b subunit [Ignavibacteriota bacterium]
MGILSGLYSSSVGKKILMGTTGLFLCIYLVVHLAGNLLLFKNDNGESFNAYAELLPSLTIIRIIEIVLFAIFAGHIVLGTIFWTSNRKKRPKKYEVNKQSENSSIFSRTMFLTGSIVFIFLVVHMRQFWGPSRFATGEVSMYHLVKTAFANPLYAMFYIIAMALLAFHLRHGFQSALQTFGVSNQKYALMVKVLGIIFWLVIPAGFAAMPLFFLLNS